VGAGDAYQQSYRKLWRKKKSSNGERMIVSGSAWARKGRAIKKKTRVERRIFAITLMREPSRQHGGELSTGWGGRREEIANMFKTSQMRIEMHCRGKENPLRKGKLSVQKGGKKGKSESKSRTTTERTFLIWSRGGGTRLSEGGGKKKARQERERKIKKGREEREMIP